MNKALDIAIERLAQFRAHWDQEGGVDMESHLTAADLDLLLAFLRQHLVDAASSMDPDVRWS